MPTEFDFPTVKALLLSLGVEEVYTLDLFDGRADLRYDLNLPIPGFEYEQYSVVADMGTLEHVFDTKQALENCLRMVMVRGLYFLVTPVSGYAGHGAHVFHPEIIRKALKFNGFKILYEKYCTQDGEAMEGQRNTYDVLLWMVGYKRRTLGQFIIPQFSSSRNIVR